MARLTPGPMAVYPPRDGRAFSGTKSALVDEIGLPFIREVSRARPSPFGAASFPVAPRSPSAFRALPVPTRAPGPAPAKAPSPPSP
jgi:hypothetical protein